MYWQRRHQQLFLFIFQRQLLHSGITSNGPRGFHVAIHLTEENSLLTFLTYRTCWTHHQLWNMFSKCLVTFLHFSILVRVLMAHECKPCDIRTCPPKACESGRTLAKDPCGCCDQCSRLEWEPCGGEDWELGYCALGLTCAAVSQTGAATLPDIGVCKGG